jgi:hypothetical protein
MFLIQLGVADLKANRSCITRHTENGLARASAAPPLYDLPTLRSEQPSRRVKPMGEPRTSGTIVYSSIEDHESLAQTADAIPRCVIL